MTVREDRELPGPPAKALAALATAGENLGYSVRDVRADKGLLLMSSGPKIAGASLGFLVAARVRRLRDGSLLSIDVTPVLGSWAVHSAREALDELVREFQAVMAAPKARIRSPEKARPGHRPFGYTPEILALVWAGLTVSIYGLGFGGWGWAPAALSLVGAGAIFRPLPDAWWSWTITAVALLTLPFGALGAIARRLALANHYWQGTLAPSQR